MHAAAKVSGADRITDRVQNSSIDVAFASRLQNTQPLNRGQSASLTVAMNFGTAYNR